MKEFYGSVSLTARVNFCVEAEDKDTAKDIVFEDIEGLELILKDGSKLLLPDMEWELIEKARGGNVQQPYVSDFDIEEEKG